MAEKSASHLIDQRIRDLDDWRGETLARMRTLIREADPEIIEEVKWRGTPVWSHGGIVCTGETYKNVVKLTFAKGAHLPDPARLFNSSLDGNMRRAIDIKQGEQINARAFKVLVKEAIALNATKAKPKTKSVSKPMPKPEANSNAKGNAKTNAKGATKPRGKSKVVLLSGGNPQIAKGEGDAPVQVYIAALSDWRQDVCRRLDALIERTVPHVQKSVRWNSPMYAVEGHGWIASFHVFTKYVKLTFFAGKSLRPLPPGGTERSGKARWVDIREGELDEAQLARWIKQAAAIPGWIP